MYPFLSIRVYAALFSCSLSQFSLLITQLCSNFWHTLVIFFGCRGWSNLPQFPTSGFHLVGFNRCCCWWVVVLVFFWGDGLLPAWSTRYQLHVYHFGPGKCLVADLGLGCLTLYAMLKYKCNVTAKYMNIWLCYMMMMQSCLVLSNSMLKHLSQCTCNGSIKKIYGRSKMDSEL